MHNASSRRSLSVFFSFLVFATCAVLLPVPAAWAQRTENVLYSFAGDPDGRSPYAGLVFDSHGNLYGTTCCDGPNGSGEVFELSPTATPPWTETVVYGFTGGVDGGLPYDGSLVFDSSGNLYGTTFSGGANNDAGVVFELSPEPVGGCPGGSNTGNGWCETVLYNFCSVGGSNCTDGQLPYSGVIFDSHGNLYGTTEGGGTSLNGTVFELSPPSGGGLWTENVLYSFTGLNDGSTPYASLIFDGTGNLYGTTHQGGALSSGVVFELSPTTTPPWTETILYTFSGGSDGGGSYASLVFDSHGNLYGTTQVGGSGSGVVFELSPTAIPPWTETVLHTFAGFPSDGSFPNAYVVLGSQGNLYGTTESGGANHDGMVFELSPPSGGGSPWNETALYNFCSLGGCTDGNDSYAGLIFDSQGNLYGTTCCGGAHNDGTVFELPGTPTTTTLAASPNPSTGGRKVTFTITVSPAPTAATGLGTLKLKANGVTIGSYGLLPSYDGVVTAVYSALLPGSAGTTYNMQAIYSGSEDLAGSTSNTVMQVVNPQPTTTTVSPSPSSITWNQQVMLTATVVASNPATGVVPTGTVSFKVGATLLCNGPLSGGEASCTTMELPAGMDSVTATYTGSNLMQASTSTAATVTVSKATSTTAVTSSVNPSVYGQTVSFTATVTPEDGGTPTGTVTFEKNGVSIGVLPLSGGKATLPDTSLTPAGYTITATYNGSANIGGSMGTLTGGPQVVDKASTTTAVVSSSPTVMHGTPVTYTATVTPTAPSTTVPTGSVVFYDTFNMTTTELGVGTLSAGKATLTFTYTAAKEGMHSITATYTGSAYVNASPASPAIMETVN